MILVGLTGGIGSGKTTVGRLLAERGAVIVDADEIVRDVQQPGSPVLAQLAERFGADVLAADGSLDRAALAAVAFADKDAVAALNSIVHPAVGAEINRRVLARRGSSDVVVMDIPLLTENPRAGLQAIIVVDVPTETQVRRLVEGRGFAEDDARARIARQATREQRLATATHIIDNSGDTDHLMPQVAHLWDELSSLPQLPPDWDFPPPPPKPEPPADPAG
ncbi:MAG: dephospho-CoA kinase [Ilumatobacteraceae bacterium]